MKTLLCQSSSNTITQAWGRKIGEHVTTGGTILLEGDLGAGKTTFVQGIATGLGVTQSITSPTFTILNVYPVPHHLHLTQLVHIDLYRLADIKQLQHLDLPSWQNQHTLLLVEWPERLPVPWQSVLGKIQFEHADLSQRILTCSGTIVDWLTTKN